MALSADGHRLAVLGADQTLRLYDVPTRTQLRDEIPVASKAVPSPSATTGSKQR